QALLDVDGVDGDVLGGDGVATHAARHAHALEHATRRGTGTDGARLAVVAVGTVRGTHTRKAVALHDTGEPLALAGAGDVDDLACGEGVDGQLLAHGVGRGVRGADLDHVAARGAAGLGEVPGLRLVDLAALDLAETDLDGV